MGLIYKQKNLWMSSPFEIFEDNRLAASINFQSFWRGDAIICCDKQKTGMKVRGIFLPKIILTQDNQEVGTFQFNLFRYKGKLKLTSGNEYDFSTDFLIHLNSCWRSSYGTELIAYKSSFSLFTKKGNISVMPDALAIDQNELEILKYLGVYIISLIDRWSRNHS